MTASSDGSPTGHPSSAAESDDGASTPVSAASSASGPSPSDTDTSSRVSSDRISPDRISPDRDSSNRIAPGSDDADSATRASDPTGDSAWPGVERSQDGPPSRLIGRVGTGLASATFVGLAATQFMTALSDNLFRWLAIGVGQAMADVSAALMLALGTACFVLPYIVLAAPAGYLADRFAKRDVIVGCKIAEVVILLLGAVSVLTGQLWLLLVTVALLGAQSALFSPARLGAIPELLRSKSVPAANGGIGLAIVAASIVGMGLGGLLADFNLVGTFTAGQAVDLTLTPDWTPKLLTGGVLVAVSVIGVAVSLLIARAPAAQPGRTFPWFPIPQMGRDLHRVWSDRTRLRVALGEVFFWSLASLAMLNIDQLALEAGGTAASSKTPLLAALVCGLGLGSVLAGVWSKGRVELGILPLGAAGITVCSIGLYFLQGDFFPPGGGIGWSLVGPAALLAGLGVSAGLFDVPLQIYLQERSPREHRGSILAAVNLMIFTGMLLSSGIYYLLRLPIGSPLVEGGPAVPLLTSREIFLVFGLATIPVLFYIIFLIPQASARMVVWLLSTTLYRIRIRGLANLPESGGGLLVANHVSWLDGIFLLLASSRTIRMVVYSGNFSNPILGFLARVWGAILIDARRPKEIVRAINTAREAINAGDLVCIFPEGGITRSGQVMSFKPGVMRILKGVERPVYPVYLDELWGSVFSFERGRFFWKRPKRWPYPVSIHFGSPLPPPFSLHDLRQAVVTLGADAVAHRQTRRDVLPVRLIRACKKRLRGPKVSDTTGAALTGGGLLMRTLILRRLLRRHILASDEKFVGLLLPNSLPALVSNLALAMDRRVSVNLNPTLTAETMKDCVQRAGIKHVLTSKRVLEKLPGGDKLDLGAELVLMEDFKDQPELGPTTWDKLSAAMATFVAPTSWLARWLGLGNIQGDDLVTLIYTSGSTGKPKGVMLTQDNVGSNVEAIEQAVHLNPSDILVGILPFFHSFGYTLGVWGPGALDIGGAYHYSPLDPRAVGKVVEKTGATILAATPTFLRMYTTRVEAEQFKTLDVVIVGAEKLPTDVADAFERKFGVRPSEGYGTTELSPVVSVNIPASRRFNQHNVESKDGTVGRPLPGISARVTDLDTGAELPAGQPGMLWIRGQNVMKGYLNDAEKTGEVVQDGWYRTGDVAIIDEDGFIRLTGRISRFSKIGGEMVPHELIEEKLAAIVAFATASEAESAPGSESSETPGSAADDGPTGPLLAVTAVPDPRKGERLIVLHRPLPLPTDEIRKRLAGSDLPNIFIPDAAGFVPVDEIPILGTGKLDLAGVKKLAEARVLGSQPDSPTT